MLAHKTSTVCNVQSETLNGSRLATSRADVNVFYVKLVLKRPLLCKSTYKWLLECSAITDSFVYDVISLKS